MKNKYALITVTDKKGIVNFAKGLRKLNYKLIGSLKTSKFLLKHKIQITEVSKITKYPAVMGKQGIKLIHPIIFGGILADKTNKDHIKDCQKYKINPFDIVVCNFYSFQETISKNNFNHKEALFNLDIGGPAMVRCAAKNYKNVAIITDSHDYDKILDKLNTDMGIDLTTREKLSLKAFKYCFQYDKMIIKYLTKYFKGEK